jgi:Mn2+/Fe2+ NRAMP family transporter
MPPMRSNARLSLAAFGPGLLVAATGVGAGDLLTGALAGSAAGLALVWAVPVGALLKLGLAEGIARWQMATGETLLEGWSTRLGRPVRWLFAAYLFGWTLFTGSALAGACGVAGTAILPLGDDPHASKVIWGAVHALAGWALVRAGGFKLFERTMALFVGVMFVSVVAAAALSVSDWGELLRGLTRPSVPDGSTGWLLGLLGGVGGTVTLLSYGYWIREEGREGGEGLAISRVDLAAGYGATALFGVAMVIVGSGVALERGPMMALALAGQLEAVAGPAGRWLFLVGFWGAVFSSLLGVWQGVPYLFADFVRSRPSSSREQGETDVTRTAPYRWYLAAIALLPLPLLALPVREAQLAYAIFGAFFMPFLAVTLLYMNNRTRWIGRRFRNGVAANAVLLVTLALFAWIGLGQAARDLPRVLRFLF